MHSSYDAIPYPHHSEVKRRTEREEPDGDCPPARQGFTCIAVAFGGHGPHRSGEPAALLRERRRSPGTSRPAAEQARSAGPGSATGTALAPAARSFPRAPGLDLAASRACVRAACRGPQYGGSGNGPDTLCSDGWLSKSSSPGGGVRSPGKEPRRVARAPERPLSVREGRRAPIMGLVFRLP